VSSELFAPALASAYGHAVHSSCASYFRQITSFSVVVRRGAASPHAYGDLDRDDPGSRRYGRSGLAVGLTIGGGPFRVRPQRIDYTGDGIGLLGKLIPGQKHTV